MSFIASRFGKPEDRIYKKEKCIFAHIIHRKVFERILILVGQSDNVHKDIPNHWLKIKVDN